MTNLPAPAGLFQYLQASPKLVAYDWENTRTLPRRLDADGATDPAYALPCPDALHRRLAWLVALSPKLANSITSSNYPARRGSRLCAARLWGLPARNCTCWRIGWSRSSSRAACTRLPPRRPRRRRNAPQTNAPAAAQRPMPPRPRSETPNLKPQMAPRIRRTFETDGALARHENQ